jgi:hypothetical protein
MSYYVLETLIRERMEDVERRSRMAWMFNSARADIDESSPAVSARRPFVRLPIGMSRNVEKSVFKPTQLWY